LNRIKSELEVTLEESAKQISQYLSENNLLTENVGRLEQIMSELNEKIVKF
jgi:hypothetical protein